MALSSKDTPEISPEKSKEVLAQVLAKQENKTCADCLAKGPRWASWNIGVMLCIRCSGIHRSLGVHISRVKSVNLDTWNYEQLVSMCSRGNGWAKEKFEASLPTHFQRPKSNPEMEHFIRDKYERKKFSTEKEIPLRSLAEFDLILKRKSKAKIAAKNETSDKMSSRSNTREANATARPKSNHLVNTKQPQAPNTNGDFAHHQRKSNVDDLLGLNTPPPAPRSQAAEQPPGRNAANDLFSPLQQSGVTDSNSVQQQPPSSNAASVMSKDTIMSLYGANTGMMPSNPYLAAGSYNVPVQQPMMGYPQQLVPPNMGYGGYSQQGMTGYVQQPNMPAMQQQYQWQQQQMQMQMQNMQLGTNHMLQGGMRSFNSMPQMGPQRPMYGVVQAPYSNSGMLSAFNQSGLSSSQPSLTNQMNSWGGGAGQRLNNGQSLRSNVWK